MNDLQANYLAGFLLIKLIKSGLSADEESNYRVYAGKCTIFCKKNLGKILAQLEIGV